MNSTVLFAIAAVCSWASAFVGVRALVGAISPGPLACARYLEAAFMLLVVAAFRRPSLPRRGDWLPFLGMGLSGVGFYNVSFNIGIQTVPAGASSLLLNGGVVLGGFFGGMLILREPVRWRQWLATLLIMCGLALVAFGKDVRVGGTGVWWMLLAALFGAIYSLIQKRMLMRYDVMSCLSWSIWLGVLPLLWWLPAWLDELPGHDVGTWSWIFILALLPSVMGYGFWAQVLRRLAASMATTIIATIPVVVMVFAWLYLGEWPATLTITGGLLVVGTVIWNANASRHVREPLPPAEDARPLASVDSAA